MGRYGDKYTVTLADKDRMKKEFGLVRDGEPWTEKEKAQLLEWFIDEHRRYASSRGLCNLTQRGKKGVKAMLWKLATRYERLSFDESLRKSRDGLAWSVEENMLLKLACGDKGIRFQANSPVWLGKIFGRSPSAVKLHMRELAKRSTRGFGIRAPKWDELQFDNEKDVAKLTAAVYQVLDKLKEVSELLKTVEKGLE